MSFNAILGHPPKSLRMPLKSSPHAQKHTTVAGLGQGVRALNTGRLGIGNLWAFEVGGRLWPGLCVFKGPSGNFVEDGLKGCHCATVQGVSRCYEGPGPADFVRGRSSLVGLP